MLSLGIFTEIPNKVSPYESLRMLFCRFLVDILQGLLLEILQEDLLEIFHEYYPGKLPRDSAGSFPGTLPEIFPIVSSGIFARSFFSDSS